MASSNNKSLGSAILHAKCPRCREGDMFKFKWWQIMKLTKFYQHCPHCNLRFDREPGFFQGAMFVSYAMNVALVTTVWVVLYFIFHNPSFEVYIYTILLLNIVLLPILFRYSRVLYLYAFGGVKFDNQLNNY